jgi:hypothetical protein
MYNLKLQLKLKQNLDLGFPAFNTPEDKIMQGENHTAGTTTKPRNHINTRSDGTLSIGIFIAAKTFS